MKIKNVILCASLLLLAAGCNQSGANSTAPDTGTPTTANTNAPTSTNTAPTTAPSH